MAGIGNYARASQMLAENRKRLELLVEHLLEAETMDGRDVEELIKEGRIRNDDERAAQESAHEDSEDAPPAIDEPLAQPADDTPVSEEDGAVPPPLPWE